jgi:hypothetical protein
MMLDLLCPLLLLFVRLYLGSCWELGELGELGGARPQ